MKIQKIQWRLRETLANWAGTSSAAWGNVQAGFVISTGRTGTVFLAKLLHGILDRVDVRHEPRPDLFELGMAYVRGEITRGRAEGGLRRRRRGILREINDAKCRHYLEANPNLAYLTPLLPNCFPDYRIAHVVRDGRDVVRSWYGKSVDAPRGEKTIILSNRDLRRRLQACDLTNDPYRASWATMSRLERLSWKWVTKDRLIRDAIADDPRARTFRFEDIFSPEREFQGLFELIRFLELEDRLTVTRDQVVSRMSQRANATVQHALAPWVDWSKADQELFETIAGEHMRRCGYELAHS